MDGEVDGSSYLPCELIGGFNGICWDWMWPPPLPTNMTWGRDRLGAAEE